MDCGPKPTGEYRVVMIGGSTAMGWYVQREDSLAATLPSELSLQTGRKVELYNQGLIWKVPHDLAMHTGELTAASPDLILWVLTVICSLEEKGELRSRLLQQIPFRSAL